MAKLNSFLVLLFLMSGSIQAQDAPDPHAKFLREPSAVQIFPTPADNPLYVNINLSGNPAPQNEPTVRISRTNRNIIVAAWRDFRMGYPPNPVVRRIGYTYSTNGGANWAASQLLPDPTPTYVSQSDPVLTSDAQGNFYLSSTSRKSNNFPELRDQIVYKSTNSGQTWFLLGAAIVATGGGGEDKEWMFCDPVPTNPTYNNIFLTSTNTQTGVIRFVKSTNGGVNWSTPVNVGSGGTGSNIASGTNGYIYVVWDANGPRFSRSTDFGASFGAAFQIYTANMNGFPFICVDYSNRQTRGNVYVVWDDNNDVWFQRSTNGGTNWLAAPIRINDVTTNSQIWPAIQCDTNGILSVVYYDNRTGSAWNSYFAYSTDAGNTWFNSVLSDMSFPRYNPGGDVRYGDYIGIDAFSNKIFPVWTDDRLTYPNQEIFTAIVTIPVGIESITNSIPNDYILLQNYPNPFNPSTTIDYVVPKNSWVTLKVYDILGNEVAVISDGYRAAGLHSVTFDASTLASGVYYYTLKAPDFTDTKRMILVK